MGHWVVWPEKASSTTAIAGWNGCSSGMICAELMDLLLLGNTCADISGWSMATCWRCQRDWFNAGWVRQCLRCVFESLSALQSNLQAFVLRVLLHRAGGTKGWHGGRHGQQMAQLLVTLPLVSVLGHFLLVVPTPRSEKLPQKQHSGEVFGLQMMADLPHLL